MQVVYHVRGKRKNYVVDTPRRLSLFVDRKINELQKQKSGVEDLLIPGLEKNHFLSSGSTKIETESELK